MDCQEALHDLQAISAIGARMTRRRRDIYRYLSALYRVGGKWLDLPPHERRILRDTAINGQQRRVDPRAARTVFRLLIELTLECDARLKWRYARALQYARTCSCRVEDLSEFFKRHGGIEGCSRKYQS